MTDWLTHSLTHWLILSLPPSLLPSLSDLLNLIYLSSSTLHYPAVTEKALRDALSGKEMLDRFNKTR